MSGRPFIQYLLTIVYLISMSAEEGDCTMMHSTLGNNE